MTPYMRRGSAIIKAVIRGFTIASLIGKNDNTLEMADYLIQMTRAEPSIHLLPALRCLEKAVPSMA